MIYHDSIEPLSIYFNFWNFDTQNMRFFLPDLRFSFFFSPNLHTFQFLKIKLISEVQLIVVHLIIFRQSEEKTKFETIDRNSTNLI